MTKILETLRFSFEDSDSAAQGRAKLLQAGVSVERISIQVLSDEAGPPVGNFALDTKDGDRGGYDSLFDKIFTRDDPNEGVAREPVRWHSATVLLVDANDADEKERISRLLDMPIKSL